MSEIYRDPTEGAAAKRQDLLRRRRDELATMPHAIRRVVVARAGRRAAGIAMTVGGLALVVAGVDANIAQRIAGVMPGIQPAPLSTLLAGGWLLATVAYLWARVRAEHRFAVAMSRFVLPTSNLEHDVERLDHEHTDEQARLLAHKMEVRSAAWPVLGAALLVPPTALYVAQAIGARGWPQISGFEHALGEYAWLFAKVGVAGAIAALALTHRVLRRTGALAPITLAVLGLGALAFLRESPELAAFAVPLAAIGFVLIRLRSERKMILAADPAAGSEMFSLRDALASAWRGTIAAARKIEGRTVQRTLLAAAPLALIVAGYSGWKHVHATAAPSASQIVMPDLDQGQLDMTDSLTKADTSATPSVKPDVAHYHSAFGANGDVDIDLTFDGDQPIDVPSLGGIAAVPPHWAATLSFTTASAIDVQVPGTNGVLPISTGNAVHLDSCDQRAALKLRVAPREGTHTHSAHLAVHVELSPAACHTKID